MAEQPDEASIPLSLRSYYAMLRKEFDGFTGDLGPATRRIPDFIDLLTNLLADTEEVAGKERLYINAAIGYVIAPEDVFPEARESTPSTYIDDVFTCAYVVRKLADSLGESVLEKHWDKEEDVVGLANRLYEKARQRISKQDEERILQYTGLNAL